jgi:hypothetical protein
MVRSIGERSRPNEALEADTKLDIPHDVTEVYLTGTPLVVTSIGPNTKNFKLPDPFRELLLPDVRRIADLLRPFDRGSP